MNPLLPLDIDKKKKPDRIVFLMLVGNQSNQRSSLESKLGRRQTIPLTKSRNNKEKEIVESHDHLNLSCTFIRLPLIHALNISSHQCF